MMGKDIELSRRRVLVTIVVIGLASAGAGAGTMALFSDTEASTGNTVTAGTLNLTLSPDSATGSSVNVQNAAPGDQGYVVLNLTNEGSINGSTLNATLNVTNQADGTPTEFETADSDGELDENLQMQAYLEQKADAPATGTYTSDYSNTATAFAGEASLDTLNGTAQTTGEGLQTGSSKFLVVEYRLPSTTGNVVQGDTTTFDIEVTLEQ